MKTRSGLKHSLAASSLMLLLCSLASAQSATVQAASGADAWGDAVDGIQLHLAVTKNPPPWPPQLPGELPHLEIQIRNMGTDVAIFSCHVGQMSQIEIDGVWFDQGGFVETATCAPPPELGSRSQSANISLPLQTLVINRKLVPADKLNLKPGKHTIRVMTAFGDSGRFGVFVGGSATVALLSNAITIDVPGALTARAMEYILRDLSVPELAVVGVHPNRNGVTAFYNRRGEPVGSPTPTSPCSSFVAIDMSSYDSEEETRRGLGSSLNLTQVVPTHKQDLEEVTIYKWGEQKILFRAGQSVVNIMALKPEAEPVIVKV
jgi:hypothetical protein